MVPVTSSVATSMMSMTPESSAETQSSLASGRQREAARAGVDQDVGDHLLLVDVDDVHEVRRLRRDEDELAVGGDLHPLGLLAGLEEAGLLAGLEIPDGRRGVLLVRDVEVPAVGVEVEGLGLGARR